MFLAIGGIIFRLIYKKDFGHEVPIITKIITLISAVCSIVCFLLLINL
jgi:hypothetical protein